MTDSSCEKSPQIVIKFDMSSMGYSRARWKNLKLKISGQTSFKFRNKRASCQNEKEHQGEVKLQISIFLIAKIGLMRKTCGIHFKGAWT
jgi:hypothetical protein